MGSGASWLCTLGLNGNSTRPGAPYPWLHPLNISTVGLTGGTAYVGLTGGSTNYWWSPVEHHTVYTFRYQAILQGS